MKTLLCCIVKYGHNSNLLHSKDYMYVFWRGCNEVFIMGF
jgi:hypothetical protein